MNPRVADELQRDPLKLSLRILGGGGCHLTKWNEVEGEEEAPLGIVSTNMRVWMLQSVIVFFVPIRHVSRLKILFQNVTAALREFQMLHKRKAIFYSVSGLQERSKEELVEILTHRCRHTGRKPIMANSQLPHLMSHHAILEKVCRGFNII